MILVVPVVEEDIQDTGRMFQVETRGVFKLKAIRLVVGIRV